MPGSTAAETAAIQDILVEDGKFISIAPNLKATLEAQGKDMASVEVVDLGGKLVCPPFCDTHLHLDYVFTARKPGAVNESGTLFEGIQRWSDTKSDLTVDEIKARARKAIGMELRHGVQCNAAGFKLFAQGRAGLAVGSQGNGDRHDLFEGRRVGRHGEPFAPRRALSFLRQQPLLREHRLHRVVEGGPVR